MQKNTDLLLISDAPNFLLQFANLILAIKTVKALPSTLTSFNRCSLEINASIIYSGCIRISTLRVRINTTLPVNCNCEGARVIK
jgi:hypothetical protein